MFEQMYNYFKNNELFYNSQYGFRKNHSTELATLEIIDRIIQDMDKYSTTINKYIDLSNKINCWLKANKLSLNVKKQNLWYFISLKRR